MKAYVFILVLLCSVHAHAGLCSQLMSHKGIMSWVPTFLKPTLERYQIIEKIRELEPELKQLVAGQNKELTTPICRGASALFRKIVNERLGINLVAVRNQNHTFLMLPHFYGNGDPLIIDPTYQQFALSYKKLPVPNEPLVFVGTKNKLLSKLREFGAPDFILNDYFERLKDDSDF